MKLALETAKKMMDGNCGSLDLSGTPITSLPEGLTVGDSLYLSGTPITSLPKNLTVGRWLDLRGTPITSKNANKFDMVITGERRAEGGVRSVPRHDNTSLCFGETSSGQYRLRPLYYVTDADKAWYKQYYGIRYSDAYEVYGLTRTGCCGCPISYKAADDLEKIRPYEPNVVKAAWNIFGKSYEYRAKYNKYKEERRMAERKNKFGAQISLFP